MKNLNCKKENCYTTLTAAHNVILLRLPLQNCVADYGPGLPTKLCVIFQVLLVVASLEIRFLVSAEKIYTASVECKKNNSLLVSNPEHKSFYTVKLKH